jgi:hypothetical protein
VVTGAIAIGTAATSTLTTTIILTGIIILTGTTISIRTISTAIM